MLLALIFRGVSFEFRYRDAEHRTFWDHGFAAGSALAAFAQGIVLGAFIQGFNVQGRQFVGGSFDCFTPFSIFCGLALMCGYALLGSGWLIIKTEGALQDWARSLRPPLPDRHCHRYRHCQSVDALCKRRVSPRAGSASPNIVYLAPVPLITAGLIWYVWQSLNDRSEYAPFFTALGLFVMSYIGIAISLWPMIVPGHFTLEQAAASPSTQAFLLIGTLFLLPVILVYTAWSYWVFRGKVRSDIGYH